VNNTGIKKSNIMK